MKQQIFGSTEAKNKMQFTLKMPGCQLIIMDFYSLNLLGKKNIADGVTEFRFDKPSAFNFVPGQFVQFKIPAGDKHVLRSYSISSTPHSTYLEFCIKIIPGGVASNFLNRLEIGQKAEITGPKGVFNCEPVAEKYFIATGVGLAPIIAMLENFSSSKEKAELLFGARTEEDLFWLDRLEQLKIINPNFNYRITLSKAGEGWRGLHGRVTDHLVVNPLGHYYICGRVEMVKDVRRILVENGVNTKSVHFEIF